MQEVKMNGTNIVDQKIEVRQLNSTYNTWAAYSFNEAHLARTVECKKDKTG
jgi:hypothetical protein